MRAKAAALLCDAALRDGEVLRATLASAEPSVALLHSLKRVLRNAAKLDTNEAYRIFSTVREVCTSDWWARRLELCSPSEMHATSLIAVMRAFVKLSHNFIDCYDDTHEFIKV